MSEHKIGYLGPKGTFSYEAALHFAKNIKDPVFIPYSSFYDILLAVDRKETNLGVVPVENSIEGTIGIVQDMLVKDVDLKIRGEFLLPVKQALMCRNKLSLDQISRIYSHSQPIEQCRIWLRNNTPQAELNSKSSTAEAAAFISQANDQYACTIGPSGLADIYDLKIIEDDITDYHDNTTRFLMLSKADMAPSGSDKTSIVFSIAADRPGGLYSVLGEFSSRGINLTKIESRPSKKALGDYFFFVDMEGHKTDAAIAQALSDIVAKTAFIKILGSYPKGAK